MGSSASVTDRKISLKNKGIRNLDTDIKKYDLIRSYKTPQSINLSNNKIVVISPLVCEDISKLKNIQDHLREIILSHNKIRNIPGAFLLLINLEHLRLNHNEIESIPPKFADCLYNLKTLLLNNNKLQELPWNLNKLRCLKKITLDNNLLTYIPNTFGELNVEFTLHANPLDETLFEDSTEEGTLAAILNQKIPREYREQVQRMIDSMEEEGKGKTKHERQFIFFLQQAEFRNDFAKYMEKECSRENLDFWQRVDSLKWRYCSIYPIQSPELIQEAYEIYNLYIVGSNSVNLPSVNLLRDQFSGKSPIPINQSVFDSAYEAALKLMYSDTFSRYLLTPEGSANFAKAVIMWDALPINRLR